VTPRCRHCGVGIAGIPAAHRGGPCPSCGQHNPTWKMCPDPVRFERSERLCGCTIRDSIFGSVLLPCPMHAPKPAREPYGLEWMQ
jgi:hypothetical protein